MAYQCCLTNLLLFPSRCYHILNSKKVMNFTQNSNYPKSILVTAKIKKKTVQILWSCLKIIRRFTKKPPCIATTHDALLWFSKIKLSRSCPWSKGSPAFAVQFPSGVSPEEEERMLQLPSLNLVVKGEARLTAYRLEMNVLWPLVLYGRRSSLV